MTVSVSFATSSSSDAPTSLPVYAGELSPSGSSTALDFYIQHDGTNSITDAKFYVLPYSAGVYLGTDSAQDDYDKIISWGDASGAGSHSGGGVYLSMDATNSFPSSSYNQFRTGYGDTLGTAVTLDADSVDTVTTDGTLPASAEAHIKIRVDVPSGETDSGTVYFDLLLAYTATS